MLKVINNRTKHIRLVIQDIQNEHNISACLRSAEAFGVQNIDVVKSYPPFKPSTSTRGCDNWLSINQYENISECIDSLKQHKYKIYVALPDKKHSPIDKLDILNPFALVFGNEKRGVDPVWVKNADKTFTIPMNGFVPGLYILELKNEKIIQTFKVIKE